jgi:hypothetical protein
MKLLLVKNTALEKELEFTVFKEKGIFKLFGNKIQNIKNIGIFLSGGLDSAALLCLIIKELKHTNMLDNFNIICFTVDKGEGQVIYATNVVKEVSAIFNVNIEHVVFLNEGHTNRPGRIGTDTYNNIADYTSNIIFYQGINNVPPIDIKTFNSTFEGYDVTEVSYLGKNTLLFPFLNLHKPQIIDILYQLDCSSIIQYTQTCTERSAGRCGICYWCEERAWGFKILEKQDPAIS